MDQKKVNSILVELRRKSLLPSSISNENREILDTILALFSKYDINDIPRFVEECHRSFKEAVFNSKISDERHALVVYGPQSSGKSTFLKVLLQDNVDTKIDLQRLSVIQKDFPSRFQPMKLAVCEYEFSDSLFFMRMAQAITHEWNWQWQDLKRMPAGIYGLSKKSLKFIYPAVTASLLLKFLYALENKLDIAMSTSSFPFDHVTLIKFLKSKEYNLTCCDILATPKACEIAAIKRINSNYHKFSDLNDPNFSQPPVPDGVLDSESFFFISHSHNRLTSKPTIGRSVAEIEKSLIDEETTKALNLESKYPIKKDFKSVHDKSSLNDQGLFKQESNVNDDQEMEDESDSERSVRDKRERICTGFLKCTIS
ncbi:MAG: hypothetical protein CMF41_04510 [Legionellales bacterium]|nr:hypothetical protein [Legionellales bacterium]OUX64951.1 MAG: hypothetical protein CBE41_02425 [Gammaproteobacteria bacterium TMED281]